VALRPVERLLLAYLALTTTLALVRVQGAPSCGWVVLANLLTAFLVALVAWGNRRGGAATLRTLYPLGLLLVLYPAIDILNRFGGVAVHDRIVQGWELALFHEEPSRTLRTAWTGTLWSPLFHAAYLAYYPIVAAPVLVALRRGRHAAADRAVFWLMSTFLLCYVGFLFFPVAGPYYEFPRPPASFLDNWAARTVYATLARGSAYGAAFPSSHVAATIVAVIAAFGISRRLGWSLVLPAALLVIGVVYCQMHYAVDAAAGLVVAAGIVLFSSWRGKGQGESSRAPDAPLTPPQELLSSPTEP